ncbi:hypothetical protein SUGI_0469310 [Cryptomeria japonica]|uniref:elongation of fatty acids protein 3-like n=1 Tax=Cryptomeria japonica TaxID=3369 RepID=UPI002408F17D|nr:elongation of fatty acids protein 3-like [Cryptomeria japonica]XP_057833649.1 elongation of fatty acids protein 3-like [Cryptomeria japonica]GLJ24545.1 hypothetical protein SUGI_0468960 [Cryptomeria japonica]GLJ24561.1 hypothetical protein SUGI_0469310 [Cryptomeria japonica]
MYSFSKFLGDIRYWTANHPAITHFRWSSTTTWGASWQFLVTGMVSYLLLVAILVFIMKKKSNPLHLGPIPVIHNMIILSLSALMVVGCWEAAGVEMEQTRWLWGRGSYERKKWIFCFPIGTQPIGRLFFWSYVFYLSKFYEFVDTIILVLKKRPLTFLHVYHHAVVVVMCFLWLEYSQSLQIIALITNASVHTLMYTYYLLCSIGYPPPWKKLVTNCQIVQFLFSFLVSIVLLWLHFTGNGCAGMGAWVFNALFNGSLLVLFFNFHRKQYRQMRMKSGVARKRE